jgi:hypothetical protein
MTNPLAKPLLALLGVAAATSVTSAWAQHYEFVERPRAEERFHSPHWVYDTHHHLNHYYPVHGEVVGALPAGAVSVAFGGGHYYFHGGVFFSPAGPGYVVVAPPLGVVVPVLPPAYATLRVGGVPYYYANDVYYAPARGGYVVTAPPPGIDHAAGVVATTQERPNDPSAYPRAFAACMDGRGYSVR